MTITVTTDVFCNNCGTWIHGTTAPAMLAVQARNRAKKSGWTHPKRGVDFCPDCSVAARSGFLPKTTPS